MGRASRTKRERREARSRVAAKSDAISVTSEVHVETAVENVRTEPDVGWGGRRIGAWRPRLYETGAKRQSAYRARKRLRLTSSVRDDMTSRRR